MSVLTSDITSTVAGAVLGSTMAADSDSPGSSASVGSFTPSGGLASFTVYYDPGDDAFKFYKPVVQIGRQSIDVEDGDQELKDGSSYYLEVHKSPEDSGSSDANTKTYTSKITTTRSSEDTLVVSVHICDISGNRVKQYHVGALCFGGFGGGITLEAASDSNVVITKHEVPGASDTTFTIGVYYG